MLDGFWTVQAQGGLLLKPDCMQQQLIGCPSVWQGSSSLPSHQDSLLYVPDNSLKLCT